VLKHFSVKNFIIKRLGTLIVFERIKGTNKTKNTIYNKEDKLSRKFRINNITVKI